MKLSKEKNRGIAMQNTTKFRSDEAKEILTKNGLATLEDALNVGQPLSGAFAYRGSRHGHREVVSVKLNIGGSGEDRHDTFYIKRQWKRRRSIPRLTDIRRGIAFCSEAEAEWNGLHRMEDEGIPVVEPWGLFCGKGGVGAIVTRTAPATHSLQDLLADGLAMNYSKSKRSQLVSAIISTITKIRVKQIAWRSMKAKHFYPHLVQGNWHICLIDCEGVSKSTLERHWRRSTRDFIDSLSPAIDVELAETLEREIMTIGKPDRKAA